jgi:hypothetical protein
MLRGLVFYSNNEFKSNIYNRYLQYTLYGILEIKYENLYGVHFNYALLVFWFACFYRSGVQQVPFHVRVKRYKYIYIYIYT